MFLVTSPLEKRQLSFRLHQEPIIFLTGSELSPRSFLELKPLHPWSLGAELPRQAVQVIAIREFIGMAAGKLQGH